MNSFIFHVYNFYIVFSLPEGVIFCLTLITLKREAKPELNWPQPKWLVFAWGSFWCTLGWSWTCCVVKAAQWHWKWKDFHFPSFSLGNHVRGRYTTTVFLVEPLRAYTSWRWQNPAKMYQVLTILWQTKSSFCAVGEKDKLDSYQACK